MYFGEITILPKMKIVRKKNSVTILHFFTGQSSSQRSFKKIRDAQRMVAKCEKKRRAEPGAERWKRVLDIWSVKLQEAEDEDARRKHGLKVEVMVEGDIDEIERVIAEGGIEIGEDVVVMDGEGGCVEEESQKERGK